MKKHTQVLLFLLVGLCAGCSKGTKGDPGPAGADGVANMYTYQLNVNAGDWLGGSSGFYYVDYSFPAITADVINSGTVSMFKQGNLGVWIAMPYSTFVAESKSTYKLEQL
jgi:hypothetical protein